MIVRAVSFYFNHRQPLITSYAPVLPSWIPGSTWIISDSYLDQPNNHTECASTKIMHVYIAPEPVKGCHHHTTGAKLICLGAPPTN